MNINAAEWTPHDARQMPGQQEVIRASTAAFVPSSPGTSEPLDFSHDLFLVVAAA